MVIKKVVLAMGIGMCALAIGTLIYASIDNLITEISNEEALNAYLKEHNLAVIEFYDPSCPVCNAFKKKGIFNEAAQTLPHISFAMVSRTEGEALHHTYAIDQFPTFIYIKDGKQFKKTVGYVNNPTFTQNVSIAFSDGHPEIIGEKKESKNETDEDLAMKLSKISLGPDRD